MQNETERDPSTRRARLSHDFLAPVEGATKAVCAVANIDGDETPKARRTSTPKAPSTTPGVWIKTARGANKTDRLAWIHPTTGKEVARVMTPSELADPERAKRRQWRELNRLKAVHDSDAARIRNGNEPIEDVFHRFFNDGTDPEHIAGPATLLKPGSLREYRRACDRFVAWCLRTRILVSHHLTGDKLTLYVPSLVQQGKQVPLAGGERAARTQTKTARSAYTINKDVRALKTVLRWLAKTKAIRVSLPEITDAMKQLPARASKDPLLPTELAQLMSACAQYDAATFKVDRRRRTDATRYKPITGFVRFMLFSGLRIQEVWVTPTTILTGSGRTILVGADVLDDQINVPDHVAKNGEPRVIPYAVSTSLTNLAPSLQARGVQPLFDFTEDELDDARKRLIRQFGAPPIHVAQSSQNDCDIPRVCTRNFWCSLAATCVRYAWPW